MERRGIEVELYNQLSLCVHWRVARLAASGLARSDVSIELHCPLFSVRMAHTLDRTYIHLDIVHDGYQMAHILSWRLLSLQITKMISILDDNPQN